MRKATNAIYEVLGEIKKVEANVVTVANRLIDTGLMYTP